MKMRIKGHVGDFEYGYFSTIKCTKQGKTYAQFDNATPAEVQAVLDSGVHPDLITISRSAYECFPFLKTF